MTKRIFTYSMAAIAAMGLSLTSCSDEMESTVDIQSGALATRTIAAGEQYGLTTVDLLAGQHNDAGDVMIWNDYENVYVQVQMQNGWEMSHIHMFVGPKDVLLDPDNGYVNKNGSPKNGQFPINEELNPAITEANGPWTYEISLEELYAGFGLEYDKATATSGTVCPVIALHAEVSKDGQSETAWGNGTNFVNKDEKKNGKGNGNSNGGGNWSMYIEDYCVTFPEEETPEQPGDEGINWYIADAQTATVANNGDHESMNFTNGNNDHFAYIDLTSATFPYTADIVQGHNMEVIGTITVTESNGQLVFDFSDMWFDENSEVTEDDLGKGAIAPNSSFNIAGFDECPAGKYKNQGDIAGLDRISAEKTITVDKKDYYYIHVEAGKLALKDEVSSEE